MAESNESKHKIIEEIMALLEEMEKQVERISGSSEVSKGVKYNLYRLLVEIKEKIVELKLRC